MERNVRSHVYRNLPVCAGHSHISIWGGAPGLKLSAILPLLETPICVRVWRSLGISWRGNTVTGGLAWHEQSGLLPSNAQETGRGSIIFQERADATPELLIPFGLQLCRG